LFFVVAAILQSKIITFGKYRGKTFEYVKQTDPSYCEWVCSKQERNNYDKLRDKNFLEFSYYLQGISPPLPMKTIYNLSYEGLSLYVGQTSNPPERCHAHAVKKSGCGSVNIPDEFSDWTFEILEECEESVAFKREAYWMNQLHPLYNVAYYWTK